MNEVLLDLNNDATTKESFECYPTVRIKKIILGSGVSGENKCAIFSLLKEIKSKFNYQFSLKNINNENEILSF